MESNKSWIYGLLTAGLSYHYTIINKDIFSHTLNRILGLSAQACCPSQTFLVDSDWVSFLRTASFPCSHKRWSKGVALCSVFNSNVPCCELVIRKSKLWAQDRKTAGYPLVSLLTTLGTKSHWPRVGKPSLTSGTPGAGGSGPGAGADRAWCNRIKV